MHLASNHFLKLLDHHSMYVVIRYSFKSTSYLYAHTCQSIYASEKCTLHGHKMLCLLTKSFNRQILFHHSQAFDSLKEHHKAWIEAYGIISWNNFLNKLIKMNETGSWIKEVIVVELKG